MMTDYAGRRVYMPEDAWPYGEIEFAVSIPDGTVISYRCGTGKLDENGCPITQMHRADGPAFIWDDGSKEWWVNGERIFSYERYKDVSGCSDSDIVLFKLKYGEINYPKLKKGLDK